MQLMIHYRWPEPNKLLGGLELLSTKANLPLIQVEVKGERLGTTPQDREVIVGQTELPH